MSPPDVTVFALGGTIAMAPPEAGGAVVPALDAGALIGAVPGLAEAARITAVDFRQAPGAHLGLDDLAELAAALERARDGGAAGAVVTQGTDTIEETAFALDLLVDPVFPVAVTGAMRHPALAGADGPANLLAAVATVADPAAAGLGVVVVMNDTIHAAALARKAHATRPDAFASPTAGPLGFVAEGTPRILLRPAARAALPRPREGIPNVALVSAHLGDDGALARGLADRGCAGAVLDAMGAGHVTGAAAEAWGEIARAMPVVLASRTGAGAVLTRTYGFPGSERDLVAKGLIRAGWLTAPKARVLLALGLAAGLDERALRAAFAAYGGG